MSPTRRGLLAGAAALAAAPGPTRAQPTWPDRPVRFVVPFPAGSTPDLTGRALSAHLAQALGQPVVVDNRSGAGGNIGTDIIAKATDGHTIGLSINGPLSTAPALYPGLPYDPLRDLTAISLLVRGAQLLVVHPTLPATDLASFIAHAKEHPGTVAFGSVGRGSGSHLAMLELAARAGGLDMLHVPYRGFPDATLDLVAGRIQAMVVTAAAVMGQVREGRVRALACTGARRFPQTPEVPTLAEQGMEGAESYGWQGLIAPATTYPEHIERLATEARKAMTDPGVASRLQAAGFETIGNSPADFRAFLAEETERWGGLIRRLGIQAEQ